MSDSPNFGGLGYPIEPRIRPGGGMSPAERIRLAQAWLPTQNNAQASAMIRAAESLRMFVGMDRALADDIVVAIRGGLIEGVSIECGPGRDGVTDRERKT